MIAVKKSVTFVWKNAGKMKSSPPLKTNYTLKLESFPFISTRPLSIFVFFLPSTNKPGIKPSDGSECANEMGKSSHNFFLLRENSHLLRK
jgi:hypothetical protein